MKARFPRSLSSAFAVLFVSVLSLMIVSSAIAGSAKSIDLDVDEALANFDKQVGGSKEFLKKAKGVLVFPSVIKAGFGIGGEYGEGALRINGKSKEYYNTMAASFGFQIGAQAKTIILAFMEKNALEKFRNSEGWKVGVDGSVALITLGMGDSLDTTNAQEPIVAFVFGQKGLMYNLTLEGSKFNKMDKS
jgi:lipid-binding SYLF domain-containing protein